MASMARLVAYEDSDSSGSDREDAQPTKKRKLGIKEEGKQALPPLPSSFQDLYSSTVRTSTQDDPSLHGGRKRVTPHVEGNWPTHVYLEWHPQPEEALPLSRLIATQATASEAAAPVKQSGVHSLLQNDLGVPLPLHVSLSRPLVLRTEQRSAFLDQLKKSVQASSVRAFDAAPAELRWHPNEIRSRHFLVLSLQRSEDRELEKLLDACNGVAKTFGQPLLYANEHRQASKVGHQKVNGGDMFHISIAWSLQSPTAKTGHGKDLPTPSRGDLRVPDEVAELRVPFSQVKVRIGQDVSAIDLPAARRKGGLGLI